MSATVSRPPPAHLVPPNGNSYPNSNGPNSGPQDPRVNGTNQDPGLSSLQHHVPARPIFYVPGPPPPPPPFLQYQWPMPLPYNPFASFPGMGYGLVMPPFPPPPYVEGPAYILPQPHVQPVDYRRLLQPQVHASSAPYQNPNQARRVRLPHTVPVRETVNSAVQTEPTQSAAGGCSDGSPLVRSDSGHGTASNSPLSPSCSSQKQGSAKSDTYALTSREREDSAITSTCTDGTVKRDFNIPHLTPTKTVDTTCVKAVENLKGHMDSAGQKNVHPFRNGHSNMWSVSTPDSMVPVCSSSQQEDETVKERRVSVPDILMSWGGGTPQTTMLKKTRRDKEVSQNEDQPQSMYQHPAEPTANNHDAVHLTSENRDTHFKVLKLPFVLCELLSESRGENESRGLVGPEMQLLPYTDDSFPSPHKPQNVPDGEYENEETFPHEDTAELLPHPAVGSCQRKSRMNESIWSVESLPPYLPPKECLLQKSVFEPEMITELTEDENARQSAHRDGLSVKSHRERRQSCLISSDSVPMSDSWLIYSDPAEKPGLSEMPEMHHETVAFKKMGPKQGLRTEPSEKDPSVLTAGSAPVPCEEHMEEKRSSEPEAKQSPNQDSLIVIEHREKSPCSPEENETLLLNSVAGETLSASQSSHKNGDMVAENVACGEEILQLTKKPQCVQTVDQSMIQVRLSKGHLVDCGIQCMTLKECICSRDELQNNMEQNKRHPLKCSDMKKANGGKADGFWKNHKRHNQWRGRGGNGRNPRY